MMHTTSANRIRPALMMLWAVVCVALAGGCASKAPRGALAPADTAATVWNAYKAYSAATERDTGPFRLETSLRYNAGDDGHRVIALIWGNGKAPLRLDIMAGIGATVAKIRETDDTFLAYSPNEQKAYHHYGDGKALFSFGVPVPFSVSDLTAMLDGRFGSVFGLRSAGEATLVPGMGIAYTLEGKRPGGSLVISEAGLPVRWTDGTADGWNLAVTYAEDADATATPMPRKLVFQHGKGYNAIILVKERVRLDTPFSPEQLGLELPEGTTLLPLRSLGRK
ncbi:conserved hypothetical protein [Nitratidesulfovibrio vulgaris DP4]|uniref:Lipoprotein n=1 Tax=Nitratidesulfovibrio vulgaris (strain DP4) TaxID=391774 RepID=A0A0H3A8J1_NITV4|nr:conserved hypothetical protein [Nitratidesulfovibrio vulgaris DP4]